MIEYVVLHNIVLEARNRGRSQQILWSAEQDEQKTLHEKAARAYIGMSEFMTGRTMKIQFDAISSFLRTVTKTEHRARICADLEIFLKATGSSWKVRGSNGLIDREVDQSYEKGKKRG
jgi:hypothetical protein